MCLWNWCTRTWCHILDLGLDQSWVPVFSQHPQISCMAMNGAVWDDPQVCVVHVHWVSSVSSKSTACSPHWLKFLLVSLTEIKEDWLPYFLCDSGRNQRRPFMHQGGFSNGSEGGRTYCSWMGCLPNDRRSQRGQVVMYLQKGELQKGGCNSDQRIPPSTCHLTIPTDQGHGADTGSHLSCIGKKVKRAQRCDATRLSCVPAWPYVWTGQLPAQLLLVNSFVWVQHGLVPLLHEVLFHWQSSQKGLIALLQMKARAVHSAVGITLPQLWGVHMIITFCSVGKMPIAKVAWHVHRNIMVWEPFPKKVQAHAAIPMQCVGNHTHSAQSYSKSRQGTRDYGMHQTTGQWHGHGIGSQSFSSASGPTPYDADSTCHWLSQTWAPLYSVAHLNDSPTWLS